MKFTLRKSDFLLALFPTIDLSDDSLIIRSIEEYYGRHGQQPEVTMVGESITLNFKTEFDNPQSQSFFKATSLCNQRKYKEAIPILQELIRENPSVSEYHRNLAQAFEETGEYQAAVDHLIDALRWNPKNQWALILMGNIYTKYFKDFKTAMTFFDQVLESDSENFLALSNIGGTFLQAEKMNLAERFFKRAIKVNPNFSNALHGLGIIELGKGNLLEAFALGLSALKNTNPRTTSERAIFEGFLLKVASDSVKHNNGREAVVDIITLLESRSGKSIDLQKDNSIPGEAKLEIAENYKRDQHVILFKDSVPAVDHLIIHECLHLKLILDAREASCNSLFMSGQKESDLFRKIMEPSHKKLLAEGLTRERISGYEDIIFHD